MRRPTSPAMLGRDAEVAAVEAALEAAAGGEARLILISGEAGIGKSRLVAEVRRLASARGAVVLVGATPVSGGAAIPFAPVVDALRGLRRRLTDPELAAALGPAAGDLARLVPSLIPVPVPGPDAADDPAAEGWARLRLFEGLAGLLERLGELHPPAVLVVEDLHWADQSTRDLVAFLARVLREARVAIVATVRTGEPGPGQDDVTRLATELEREDTVVHLRLDRLDERATGRLVELVTGGLLAPEDARALVERAGGNPYLAEELASADDPSTLPATLEALVVARLQGLDAQARDVLRTGAVIGNRFEYRLLVASAGADEEAVEAALREATRRFVLVAVSGAWGAGFQFRHELLREALERELLPRERAAAHARAAEALEHGVLGPADPVGIPARTARHWQAADRPRRALRALVASGRSAEHARAFPEAAVRYSAALDAWSRAQASGGDKITPAEAGADRSELLRRAGEMAALAGASAEAIRLATDAVRDAEATGSDEAVALAKGRLARFLWQAEARERALDVYADAVAIITPLPPSPAKVRLLAAHAHALAIAGRDDEAASTASRALATADAVGADGEAGRAHLALGLVLSRQGRDVEATAELRAARRTTDGAAVPEFVAPSRILSLVEQYADLAAGLGRVGQDLESNEAARDGAAMARQAGAPQSAGSRLEADRADAAYRHGRWDEAELVTRDLLESAATGTTRRAAAVTRARLATGRGRFAEAAELLDDVLAPSGQAGTDGPATGAWIAAIELGLWRDRLDDARTALLAALDAPRRSDEVIAWLELLSLGMRVEAERAELARLRRDDTARFEAEAAAGALAAEARSGTESAVRRQPDAIAALRTIDAELRRSGGTDDASVWTSAADAWDAAGRPFPAAYARWQAAERLAVERASREACRVELARAIEAAASLGAAPLGDRLASLARRARLEVRPDAGGPAVGPAGRAAPPDPYGLSARELEVLALVADGRTNRQIAEALFITEKTAGHHVSNVLGKLDVATRGEAAALAHRTGLVARGGT